MSRLNMQHGTWVRSMAGHARRFASGNAGRAACQAVQRPCVAQQRCTGTRVGRMQLGSLHHAAGTTRMLTVTASTAANDAPRITGTIATLHKKDGGKKRYGFITSQCGQKAYFNESHLQSMIFDDLLVGESVEFFLKVIEGGNVQATSVTSTEHDFPEGRVRAEVQKWFPDKGFGFVMVAHSLPRVFVNKDEIKTPGRDSLDVGEVIEFTVREKSAHLDDENTEQDTGPPRYDGLDVLVVGSTLDDKQQSQFMRTLAGSVNDQKKKNDKKNMVPTTTSYLGAAVAITGHATADKDPYTNVLWRESVQRRAKSKDQAKKKKKKNTISGTISMNASTGSGTPGVVTGDDGVAYTFNEDNVADKGFVHLAQGLHVQFEAADGAANAAKDLRVVFDVDAEGLKANDWVERRVHYNRILAQLRRRYTSQHATSMANLEQHQTTLQAAIREQKDVRTSNKLENQALMATWVKRIAEVESEERVERIKLKSANREAEDAKRLERLQTVVQGQQASSLAFIVQDAEDLDAILLAQIQAEVNHNRGI